MAAPVWRLLKGLLTRREQLIAMIVMEKNHLATAVGAVRPRIEQHIKRLQKELAKVDEDMDGQIRKSPLWQEKADLLKTVPGVGPVLCRTLVAALPELGSLDRKATAALVGVAPFACESGAWRGQRHIWGGRAGVRRALYMSALVSSRCNPILMPFYQRLHAAGKPPKLALTACMRKLLVILNAMVRDQKPWSEVPA